MSDSYVIFMCAIVLFNERIRVTEAIYFVAVFLSNDADIFQDYIPSVVDE